MRQPLFAALFQALLLIGFLTPAATSALPLEGQGWVGPGAANVHHAAPTLTGWWGPSLAAGAMIHLSDYWRVTLDAGASHHFTRVVEEDEDPIGPHTVVSTGLGIRYAFDVFTYVPYAGLSILFHPLPPPTSQQVPGDLFSARATIGLDYRLNRQRTIGVAVELAAPLTQPQDLPNYSGLRVYMAFHFQRF